MDATMSNPSATRSTSPARLAAEASPNEALVSGDTRAAACGPLAPRLERPRDLALRGLERPVAAWRLSV
jgi:class 3 adenylate cyclase